MARWTRAVPGRAGFVALAVVPFAFFAPYKWTGVFGEWQDFGSAILVGGIVLSSLGIARDVGTPEPIEFWLHQRGFPLADWALSRWLADVGLVACVAAWWTLGYTLAARLHGLALSSIGVLAISGWLAGMFAVISALLLLLGATGRGRTADSALLILIVTALLPALEALAPSPVWHGLRMLAPPLGALSEARGAVMLGHGARAIIEPLAQTLTWLLAALTVATLFLRRRRGWAP